MPRSFVLTLTGADRIGIVESITRLLLEHGGNVETSRMARLGGEFAVLMLVSMPSDRMDDLDRGLESLTAQGYKVTATATELTYAEAHPGWLGYEIEVRGADHEGIIHEVARYLSEQGISIESAETDTSHAAVSGVPLFTMTALVVAPPTVSPREWEAGLDAIAHRENLEIKVVAVPKA
jgi:glycine cleavage system transcriptional repressor